MIILQVIYNQGLQAVAITKKKCVMCNKKFLGTAKAVFCRNACRQAAHREKKRVEKREAMIAEMRSKD